MKKSSVSKLSACVLICTAVLSSCVSDADLTGLKDNLQLDQSLVIPVGSADLTIQDILNQMDTADVVGTDGTQVNVSYTDSTTVSMKDVNVVGNTNLIQQNVSPWTTPITQPIPGGVQFDIPMDDVVSMGVNNTSDNQKVDRVNGNSALISIKLSKQDLNINPSDVKIYVSFPSSYLTFNNQSSEIVHQPTMFDVGENLEIPPFVLILNQNNTYETELPIHIRLVGKTSGITPVGSSPEISVEVKLLSIDYESAFGHFIPVIDGEDEVKTIDLSDFVSSIPDGVFKLAEPQIKFDITNKVGIMMDFNLEYLKAYRMNQSGTDIYALFDNDAYTSSTTVPAASTIGDTRTTTYTLDKDNGQIDRFFDNYPLSDMLEYKFHVTNERLTDYGYTDFFTPNSSLKIKYSAILPLKFKSGSYYELSDTIKNVDLDSLFNQKYIGKAIVVMKVTNGLPVGGTLKPVFLDENDQEIQSSFQLTDSVINAAPVDSEGKVITANVVSQTIQIELTKEQMQELRATRSIAYKMKVEGEDGAPIDFETTNTLNVKVGLYLKADYDPVNDSNN